MQKFVVTPWEVKGVVDYEALIKQFGIKKISKPLLKRMEKLAGELHYMLKRSIFFAHRDLDWVLKLYEQGEEFALYTGRGPSGKTHLGHMLPWFFTRWLQEKFDAELYFMFTDDEKFLYQPTFTLEQVKEYAYENMLDVIAVGFDPKKTLFIQDTRHIHRIYEIALKVAKRITFSTARAVFGFDHSTNIGLIFYPALQAALCFYPSVLKGKNVPCLIPAAVDQDPYWRGIARAVAPKLGFYKPAQVHCKLMPGLGKGGKMSSSKPETCIFTTDHEEEVEEKIKGAFTGGQKSIEEQREKGGNPEACSIFQHFYFLFELDEEELKERYERCKSGDLLCGECKAELTKRICEFLKEHQARREKARNAVEKFLLK